MTCPHESFVVGSLCAKTICAERAGEAPSSGFVDNHSPSGFSKYPYSFFWCDEDIRDIVIFVDWEFATNKYKDDVSLCSESIRKYSCHPMYF